MTDIQWAQAKVAVLLVRCRHMAAGEWLRLAREVVAQERKP